GAGRPVRGARGAARGPPRRPGPGGQRNHRQHAGPYGRGRHAAHLDVRVRDHLPGARRRADHRPDGPPEAAAAGCAPARAGGGEPCRRPGRDEDRRGRHPHPDALPPARRVAPASRQHGDRDTRTADGRPLPSRPPIAPTVPGAPLPSDTLSRYYRYARGMAVIDAQGLVANTYAHGDARHPGARHAPMLVQPRKRAGNKEDPVTTIDAREGAQPPGGGRNLFVRNATGLVRELSAFDAFNLVFSAVLIPVGITQGMAVTPTVWPHANMLLSFLLATPLVATCGLVYLYYTVSMPRSGGDYVWVSRTLSPFFGFFANFSLTFVFLTWIAFNFTYMLSVMGPAAAYVGGWKASWLTAPSNGEMMLIATVLPGLFTSRLIFWGRADGGVYHCDDVGGARRRALHARHVRDRLDRHDRLAAGHGHRQPRALHRHLERQVRRELRRHPRPGQPPWLQRGGAHRHRRH